MKLLRIFLGLLVVAVAAFVIWSQTTPPIAPVAAPFPVKPVSGAAVLYNEAFAAIPELSMTERMLLAITPVQPWNPTEAEKLVTKFDASLKLLEKGARESHCEWGLDLNRGAEIPMGHASKWLTLAKALRLKVRLELNDGNFSHATDNLLLGFQIGRQMAEPPFLLLILVQASTDACFLEIASQNLCKFDAQSLQRLRDGIDLLPPSHSLKESVVLEKKVFLPYSRRESSITTRIKMMVDWNTPSSEAGLGPIIVRTIAGSPRLWLLSLDRIEQLYDELETLFDLPYSQAQPRIEALEHHFSRGWFVNRLASVTLPVVLNIRKKEVQSAARWMIFRTALDAQIHNPGEVRSRLAELRDPFDNGPIEMKDVEGGVELTMKSGEGKKPVKLMVGLSQK